MKNRDEQIEEIISYFDWHRVKVAMDALNWCWGSDETPPSVGRLMLKAMELLQHVYNEAGEKGVDYWSTSTAGFVVTYYNGQLSLSFVVYEWSAS